jgi:hypothetical protein
MALLLGLMWVCFVLTLHPNPPLWAPIGLGIGLLAPTYALFSGIRWLTSDESDQE